MVRVGEKVDLFIKQGNSFFKEKIGKGRATIKRLKNNINPLSLSHSICIILLNKIMIQTLASPAIVSNQFSIQFF
jgi:hypothetical protein